MQIWYISDGKAGHRAQLLGLVAALKRQNVLVKCLEIPVQQVSLLGLLAYWFSVGYFGQVPESIKSNKSPDIIVGIGHRTHWKVLVLKKLYPLAKTLVFMKPSLALSWFDYLIIPKHDAPPKLPHIFISEGVLNPLINEQRHQTGHHLILIGGPSKRHGWSEDLIVKQLQQILASRKNQQFILTTSRRTPIEFLQHSFFMQSSKHLTVCPVEQTPQGWLFDELQLASDVWITEDSVSMVYEALTAGCAVHLISMPRLKQDRITHAMDELVAQGWVDEAGQKDIDSVAGISLNEADRAARWLIDKEINTKRLTQSS